MEYKGKKGTGEAMGKFGRKIAEPSGNCYRAPYPVAGGQVLDPAPNAKTTLKEAPKAKPQRQA